jgi:outer membrane lipoprotein SlyB
VEKTMKSVDCRARRGAVLALAALPLACSIAPEIESESRAADFGATAGVVESVQPVAFYKGVPALADVFEHAVRPPSGERLLIRLDGGHWVTLVDERLQHFQPGQRVRVVSSGSVRRVEQE